MHWFPSQRPAKGLQRFMVLPHALWMSDQTLSDDFSKDTRMKSMILTRGLSAAACVAAIATIATPVFAQQSPPPRPAGQPPRPTQPAAPQPAPAAGAAIVNLKADPNQTDWTKVCGKDPATNRETCYTTRDFVAENDTPVLAIAVYETKGEGNKVDRQVRYLLPLTFLLQPGVRSSIDGSQPIAGRYTICVQNGCFAEFPMADPVFAKMKTAQTLTLQVQNQAAREVSFVIPLAGFAKGVDGPPIDPAVLEEQQKKLQEELQKRSDQMRQQLQGAAPAPGGAPAPAAPAPAPAAPAAPKP
jgi:invasion protein IalB